MGTNNSDRHFWTEHSVFKMKFYGLSKQRIIRVIRNPKRTEEGIVKNTVAVMQPVSVKKKNGKEAWSQEIWCMYQIQGIKNNESRIKNRFKKKKFNFKFLIHNSVNFAESKIRIISAWRYPGVSPKRNPIPEDVLLELENIL